MFRRFIQFSCAALLITASVALFGQNTGRWQATPAQKTATFAYPSPEGMPGPGLPPGPNASSDACAGKVPDGGAPYYLHPETKEQRQARLGTAEDPGCDPDLKKVFWRFGKAYTIGKYERQWAIYSHGDYDEGFVRPFGFVNSHRELYQHNDRYVWTWEAVPDEKSAAFEEDLRKSTETNRRFTDADVEYLQRARAEFFELSPAKSTKTLRFEESSDGLPTSGSWRNGLAVADMNGDGCPDIIAPPERAGGTGIPAIFLGDCKGHWKYWQNVSWPHRFDYGTVAAGDFNNDGHMDLAFAVHLSGIYVVLGDGKGNFTEVSAGLPRDFPTRRLVVADVDHDGYPDIVAISEGPTAVHNPNESLGKIRVYYNRDKGKRWEGVDVAPGQAQVGGDYLSVGRFSGAKYPDIVAASIYQGSPDVVYLNEGAKKWSKLDSKVGAVIPFLSFYMANTTGKFSSKKSDDVILSYARFWPTDVNEKLIPKPPLLEVSGLDRLSFSPSGVKRTPIVRWGSKFGVNGIAAADIDGDGNLDLVYSAYERPDRRDIIVLLGDGKGHFTRAAVEGLTGDRNATYDVKVADVNGDGRPDIIVMYEANQTTALSARNGSIRVFLNRGPEAPARVADR